MSAEIMEISPLQRWALYQFLCFLMVPFLASAAIAAPGAGTHAASPRAASSDRAVTTAEADVKAHPKEPDAYVRLAATFMQKARETADGAYYLRAEAACDKGLELDPKNYHAIRTRAWIYGGEHRFHESVSAAQKALAIDANDPWNYGTLGDALTELGDYDAAEKAIQKMADLQPSVTTFPRIAYLRELFGDPEGAIEMMAKAVAASSPREPEHAAWCRTQLGNLLFATGKPAKAAAQYNGALQLLPDYYAALAGRGRTYVAAERYDEAIRDLERSLQLVPMHETAVYLGDLLTLLNRPDEAARQYALVDAIAKLNAANKFPAEYQTVLFDADRPDRVAEAVRIGETQAKVRDDVKTLDALAWAYYRAGRYTDASSTMKRALRLGTKDALFHYHAGLIAAALDQPTDAIASLEAALSINPFFDPARAAEAKTLLSKLRKIGVKKEGDK